MFPVLVERWRPLAAQAAARASRRHGVTVPVDLVLAVVQRESMPAGNPASVGDNGRSFGLMQVKDTTAAEMGLASPRLLLSPAVGLAYGADYLGRQLARYGGRVPHAVAAYNAGSARFDERERFTNQRYVDHVLDALRNGAAAALPKPTLGWIMAGVGALLLAAAVASARAQR